MCVCECACHTKQPHILLTPADRLSEESREPVPVGAKPVESLEPQRRTQLSFSLLQGCKVARAGRIRATFEMSKTLNK